MKKAINFIKYLTFIILITIYSCDKDDDPIINLENLEVTINENPTNGEVIGTIQSNSNNSLTFTIVSQNPNGALAINTSTGELTVADATLFDFEVNSTITAIINADGAQNEATVTVNINNVNELSVQNHITSINENPNNSDSLGTVQATGDGSLSYSITSQNPAGALTINATTGELTVANATLFDYETNPTITATVSVDNSGNTQTLNATINLSDVHEIGEFKFGGVIFWIDPASNNNSGLVCDINNQVNSRWGCTSPNVTGATGTEIGTGATNTTAIVTATTSCTLLNKAAHIISDLNLNGYDDWFLPSKDELTEMYLNKNIIDATSIVNGGTLLETPGQELTLWSSSQSNTSTDKAWGRLFVNGWEGELTKTVIVTCRAVRAF